MGVSHSYQRKGVSKGGGGRYFGREGRFWECRI